jgi:hypothetical protein
MEKGNMMSACGQKREDVMFIMQASAWFVEGCLLYWCRCLLQFEAQVVDRMDRVLLPWFSTPNADPASLLSATDRFFY